MIHYTCDRCKCPIETQNEFRYVVRMEARAALDLDEHTDDAADRDQLLELDEVLEFAADAESELIDDEIYQQLRFDLCARCFRKFMQAPVGKEPSLELSFSDN